MGERGRSLYRPQDLRDKGKHILVADDVITTGSTMEACVNALHQAGEVKVSVVALAAAQKLTL